MGSHSMQLPVDLSRVEKSLAADTAEHGDSAFATPQTSPCNSLKGLPAESFARAPGSATSASAAAAATTAEAAALSLAAGSQVPRPCCSVGQEVAPPFAASTSRVSSMAAAAAAATPTFSPALRTRVPAQPGAVPVKRVMWSSRVLRSEGSLQLLLIDTTTVWEDRKQRLRLVDVGVAQPGVQHPTKTVLIVGATGAGKTTWLNFLVNWIAGVQWTDLWRYLLVHEDTARDQSRSQTNWVTAYRLHWQPGFKVDFSLVFIDTPGYGDTAGIDRDKAITKQLGNFLGAAGTTIHCPLKLDQLDAICFVAQASLARLTDSQKYIFHSILALFGKDMTKSILALATFADAKAPQVVSALKAAEVPYSKLLKFNNSALFLDPKSDAAGGDGSDDSDSDGAGNHSSFNEEFWKLGQSSFARFGKCLGTMQPVSLDQTRQVMSERDILECTVENINKKVREGLSVLETIRQEVAITHQFKAELEANKQFTYTVTEDKIVTKNLPSGTYVTNCLSCNKTCHYGCAFANDDDKKHCCAMDSSGNCMHCAGKCHWSRHKNMPYQYVVEQTTNTKTSDDLKAKYDAAGVKVGSHQALLDAQVKLFEATQLEVFKNTGRIRSALQRLSEIAAHPDPLSHVDYIDKLIMSEKQIGSPGWKERVAQLQQVLQHAKLLQQYQQKDWDPFAKHMTVTPGKPQPVQKEEQQLFEQVRQSIKSKASQFLKYIGG